MEWNDARVPVNRMNSREAFGWNFDFYSTEEGVEEVFDGTFDQLLWNVCSVGRAMRVGWKKNVIHIGCLVQTNVARSRFECDVKRQITINTRRTCLYVHAHTRYVSIFRVRLVFEKRIIPILCTRVYNSWNNFLLYTRGWLNLERSSLELSNGRELSFPRKYEIILVFIYIH